MSLKVKGKEMVKNRKLNRFRWSTVYVCCHRDMRMCHLAQ